MILTIPEKAAFIIRTLEENGYEAYAVGGCVRDACLGRKPKDWDITTSARPEEIKGLFRRTIDTGIAHGTVTVMLGKEGFEVTTYRIDGIYEDGRRPREVAFTEELKEDLRRRDFTINAMAYHPERGLVDLYGGAGDLKRGIIRCVGEPAERFGEDALRILRAIRFSGQLGFHIEEETAKAAGEGAASLRQISAERIRSELDSLLLSEHPDRLSFAYRAGITAEILPELDWMFETAQNTPHHCYNVGEHTIKSIEAVNVLSEGMEEKQRSILAWTMLLHDVGKPGKKTTDEKGVDHFHGHPERSACMAEEIFKRLKFDNETIHTAVSLIRWHDYRYTLKKAAMRRALNRIGDALADRLFLVQRADILAQSSYRREEKLKNLDGAINITELIRREGNCLSQRDLKINGNDLIEAGYRPGRRLGECLSGLLEAVLERPELNERETLLFLAREWKKDSGQ